MHKFIVAIVVCGIIGGICGIANRTIFLDKSKEMRVMSFFGLITMFFALITSFFFLSIVDYQYSNFLKWTADRFPYPTFMLLLARALVISVVVFAAFIILDFTLFKRYEIFVKPKSKFIEIAILTLVYSVGYWFSELYIFKPLVRLFVSTYIKY